MPVGIVEKIDDKITIKCVFCEGAGKDPFGIPSILSNCQVCLGRGVVVVRKPMIECAFCGGTGVYDDQRLTCYVCAGKGIVTIKEPTEKCPHCKGEGIAPSEYLPCVVCGGKGVVTTKK